MKPNTTTRKVMFDLPGVKAIGEYRPKQVYDVPGEEAERLVKHKGFRYADAAAAASQLNNEEG